MARKRELIPFSLSFLDIMSCGFGAVILIYIVINHSTEATSQDLNKVLMEEVSKTEEIVEDGKERMVILRNTLKETDEQTVTTDGLVLEIIQTIAELRTQLAELESDSTRKDKSIEELKIELKELEEETKDLKGSVGGKESVGKAVRSFAYTHGCICQYARRKNRQCHSHEKHVQRKTIGLQQMATCNSNCGVDHCQHPQPKLLSALHIQYRRTGNHC
jgi:hypothetical protein